MNLVCQEYAVCKLPPSSEQENNHQQQSQQSQSQQQQPQPGGALILSEFCGAAQSLSGALMVNPWNTNDVADAIHTALSLSPQESQVDYHSFTPS